MQHGNKHKFANEFVVGVSRLRDVTNLNPSSDATTRLNESLSGNIDANLILTAGDSGFPDATRVWNGTIDAIPAMIVRCGSETDVQHAVRAAREAGVPISVRGGGHDWAGRSTGPSGGLVIDLSGMRQVAVDAQTQTAAISGGATAADVINAGSAYGLVTTTGTSARVGMAGFAMGGGYGPGAAKYGLALDNIVSAQVVLADGRLVHADADSEPELLWAIKGGGGNFGVVTSLTMRMHPLETALAGFMIFGPHEAAKVWHGIEEIVASAPDDLLVDTAFITSPDGNPAILVSPTWLGEHAAGEPYIERLRSLGTVFASQIGPVPWSALIGFVDTIAPGGRHYHLRTRNVAGFSDDVVGTLIEAGTGRTSPFSTIALHCFRGVAARVAPDATAFSLRAPHYMAEIIGAWEPGDSRAGDHRRWVEHTADALSELALPGGYVNLLGPDETDRAAQTFGNNAARLLAAKAKYDPDNTFNAVPLPRH
jgi:FAD/FMN-containing dehydrogenase